MSPYGYHIQSQPYNVMPPGAFSNYQDSFPMTPTPMNNALTGFHVSHKDNDFVKSKPLLLKEDYSPRQRNSFPNSGDSPAGQHVVSDEMYSRKVFVGGLPIDTKESTVRNIFSKFGKVLIDWPRRLGSKPDQIRPMAGYVFLVFEDEASVQRLISQCFLDSGSFWLFVTSDTMKKKPVQVRPWKLGDSDYMMDPDYQMDSRLTVFIGGVPRPTRAVEIANALNQIYGPIAYVGVDTDPELKYPKGCARVTFATASGYVAALKQRHVELNHTDTPKRVEIKPYLMEEQMCDNCFGTKCHGQHAQYFCGFDQCLQYYCVRCWDHIHGNHSFAHHRPTVRQGDQTKVLDYVPHHPTNTRTNTHRAVFLKYGSHRG